MTKVTTRDKLKWQAKQGYEDLLRCQTHLTQLAAIADNRSDYINRHLPGIIALTEVMLVTLDKFTEGL